MMFGDINDAGKAITALIDKHLEPGSQEARILIANLNDLSVALRLLVEDLRGGKELRISLGDTQP
jgi:hypothetical protein